MNDFFNIPSSTSENVQIFTVNSAVTADGYQCWQKPRGSSFISMTCIGGGGGGGGGFTRTAGSDGGGGGGGACSGLARFLIPACLLPDTLWIMVGDGGLGGAPTVNGGQGIVSTILTSKTNVLPNLILSSSTIAGFPGGGVAGTGVLAGTGGAAPVISTTQPINGLGHWFSSGGLIGGAAGTVAGGAGVSIIAWGGVIPLSPGAGGASCTSTDFAGGAQTAIAPFNAGNQISFSNAAGGIAPGGTLGSGQAGAAGFLRLTPFFNSGGAGGGSFNSGSAGWGGKGGYGCGGGGGGAGTTGGNGGDGGPGIVIIIAI